MRLRSAGAALALAAAVLALGAGIGARPQAAAPATPTLAEVMAALDRAAPEIHSVGAHAEVSDYTALVDDTSTSSGALYFERTPSGPMMALDLNQPPASAKRLIYRDRTAWIYVPAAKQVQKYKLGQQQEMVNGYLLLGLGETGSQLEASFTARVVGEETLAGAPTVELELLPKAAQAAGKITRVDLWYDTRIWIAAQEQIWQPGGDYHKVRYSAIERNPRFNSDVFSTKFPGATVITPGG